MSSGATSSGRTRFFAPIDFKTRFPALDGLRAVAITAVFADHYGGGSHGGLILNILNDIRSYGWAGVDLFFVISGFLITGILYDTQNDSKFFSRFFARRAVRIFPVYYMVFVILLLLTPVVGYTWHSVQLWFLVYLGNFVGNANFNYYIVPATLHPAWAGNLGHFWSLCVEEQFYFLWPLVVWKVRRRVPLLWTAATLSVIALLLRFVMMRHFDIDTAATWIGRTLVFRMDAMLIGAMLALLLRGPESDKVQRACKWLFIGSLIPLGAMMYHAANSGDIWLQTLGFTLIDLASAGLIGATLRAGSPAFRVFHLKPLRFIGRYSYGFYVYHLLFPKVFLTILGFFIVHFNYSLAKGGAVALPLNYAITLVVSVLSYQFLEKQFLKLKTRFEYDSEVKKHQHAFLT